MKIISIRILLGATVYFHEVNVTFRKYLNCSYKNNIYRTYIVRDSVNLEQNKFKYIWELSVMKKSKNMDYRGFSSDGSAISWKYYELLKKYFHVTMQ